MKTLLLDERTRAEVEEYNPKREDLEKMSRVFSLFSDVTRLKILSALCVSDMCVTDLSYVLQINQTTLSHQLKALKDGGIIFSKRQGKIVFYCAEVEKVDEFMLSCLKFLP